MTNDVQELIHRLTEVDRRAAVWCTSQCVREMLHLVPGGEKRPRRALEAAEAWARAEATQGDCRKASDAIFGARISDFVSARVDADADDDAIVGDVSFAAACVARAACDDRAPPTSALRLIAEHEPLARFLTLVRSVRWPMTAPAPAQIHLAREALQVAWDVVSVTAFADLSIPELLEAHVRASRLSLSWDDPVARAIAERTVDEARVARLLSADVA